jgi:hypothetical protein
MEAFTWLIGNFQTLKCLNIREREYRCLCSYYVINTYVSLMYELKKKLGRHLRVNLLDPGPSSYKKNYLPGRGLTKVGKHWPNRHTSLQTICKLPISKFNQEFAAIYYRPLHCGWTSIHNVRKVMADQTQRKKLHLPPNFTEHTVHAPSYWDTLCHTDWYEYEEFSGDKHLLVYAER